MKRKANQKRAIVEEISASLDDIDARLTELLKKAHQLKAVLHHVEEAAARLPTAERLQQLREIAGELATELGGATKTDEAPAESPQPQGVKRVRPR